MDNPDILSTVYDFCGCESFIHIGPVSKTWYTSYGKRSRYTQAIDEYTTVENLIYYFNQGLFPSKYLTEEVSKLGRCDLLNYCVYQGCTPSYYMCTIASSMGHVCILDWLLYNDVCDGIRVFNAAAESNQIKVIEWAIDNGLDFSDEACCKACSSGNLEILKLLLSHGFQLDGIYRTACGIAIENNHTCIVDYLMETDNHIFESMSLVHASQNGNLKIIKILRSYGYSWAINPTYFGVDTYVISEAVRYGHTEIVKWMFNEGCPFDYRTFREAAGNGDIDMMAWLKENNCPFNNDASVFASAYSKLDSLKWLHSNGFPWDIRTSFSAAFNGDKKILEFLIDNGCPCTFNEESYSTLVNRGHIEILVWIEKRKNNSI